MDAPPLSGTKFKDLNTQALEELRTVLYVLDILILKSY